MARLNELKEQRAAKVAEMRALNEKALNADRDLNDAEQREWNALQVEHRNIEGQIQRAEKIASMERQAEAESVDNGMGREMRSYSVSKALRQGMNGNLDGLEAEYHAEASKGRQVRGVMIPTAELMEQRALKTTTPGTGPGGNLIATNLAPVQDRFRSMLKVETLGATVMRGLTGNIDLPNLKESGTSHWIAEHTDTTRSDAKFSKVAMGPKTVSGEYEVSRRMLLQSDTALEALLRSEYTPGGRRLRVRTNKRSRIAHIPITPALASVIDATPHDRLLILTNASGNQLTEHRASEGVRQWRDKASLSSELRLQDCRGTAATRLLDAGLSLSQIASHMGWSIRYAANVIEHYARVSPNETDAILVKLAQAKGGNRD